MWKQWLHKGFFNEADDFGGGGGGAVVSDADVDSDVDYDVNDDDESEGNGQPWQDPLSPPASKEPTFTAEQWAKMQQQMTPQQPQAPQQMTPEQIDQMLKVYNPTAELVEAMFGDTASPESRLQAMQGMVKGIVEHLTTVMGYSNDILRQDLAGQFSPALDMVREQKETTFSNALQDTYPALKGQDRVIRQVMSSLRQQGYKPKDGLEAARMVAGQVEAMIRTVNPQFSLANGGQKQGQQTNMPSMAGGMTGGGGGRPAGAGNGGSGGQQKKPSWQSVFE